MVNSYKSKTKRGGNPGGQIVRQFGARSVMSESRGGEYLKAFGSTSAAKQARRAKKQQP